MLFSASMRNAGNPQVTFDTTVYAPGHEPFRKLLIPWLWGIVVGTVVIGGILVLWSVRAHRRRNLLMEGGARGEKLRSGLAQAVTAIIILALTIGYSLGLEALQVSKFAPSISDLLWLPLGGVLLVISFLGGLLFQSRKAGVIPILGFLIGFFLWHALPWAASSPFTGDAGRFSIVLFPGVPSLLMYFAFLFGRVLR